MDKGFQDLVLDSTDVGSVNLVIVLVRICSYDILARQNTRYHFHQKPTMRPKMRPKPQHY